MRTPCASVAGAPPCRYRTSQTRVLNFSRDRSQARTPSRRPAPFVRKRRSWSRCSRRRIHRAHAQDQLCRDPVVRMPLCEQSKHVALATCQRIRPPSHVRAFGQDTPSSASSALAVVSARSASSSWPSVRRAVASSRRATAASARTPLVRNRSVASARVATAARSGHSLRYDRARAVRRPAAGRCARPPRSLPARQPSVAPPASGRAQVAPAPAARVPRPASSDRPYRRGAGTARLPRLRDECRLGRWPPRSHDAGERVAFGLGEQRLGFLESPLTAPKLREPYEAVGRISPRVRRDRDTPRQAPLGFVRDAPPDDDLSVVVTAHGEISASSNRVAIFSTRRHHSPVRSKSRTRLQASIRWQQMSSTNRAS